MLLSLFALEKMGQSVLGEHPVGVGVQYFSARYPLIPSDGRLTEEEALAERGKRWRRKGLLLSDSDVLNAMEPDIDAVQQMTLALSKILSRAASIRE